MRPFHTIAIPHKDIIEGTLEMDIFAADLWAAYSNRGPAEYRDAELFFQKTYETQGLRNLLDVIKRRIDGRGGESIIQLQTPFGGGKTHSLIAVMHKARTEWRVNTVVIVGTNLDAQTTTLWKIIEEQLTGRNEILTGRIAPGKDRLRQVLTDYQPLVILIDEILEYTTKAAGVPVGESTLSAQTMAFMQELTETVASLEKVCLVISLPSSLLEHYDQEAERMFTQLQKITGRMEKVYTPVEESEIAKIIRRRLFSKVNEIETKKIVQKFVEYAQNEGILPTGLEPTEYRDRFLDSYPFMPEVIDVLYQRWGSFPQFQRTRGVLRLLALVVASLKESNIPYISLADFNLGDSEIRHELIKYIGPEYDSVLAQDITSADAGSKKVDMSLGESYKGMKLATRSATTIFMYSFSGGPERGATISEIKRSAGILDIPASVVAEAVSQLQEKLFYLQERAGKYFFSNQPNLNRILLIKMENVPENDLLNFEKKLIEENVKGEKFKVFIWEEDPMNIPDNEELKLVILKETKPDVINNILKKKGERPRANPNVIFFLLPQEQERTVFLTKLKQYKAYELIEKDTSITLTDEQKEEVKKKINELKDELKEELRKCYRKIGIPQKDGYKLMDLGIPTYGERSPINNKVYDALKIEGEIVENIAPLVIKEKYLKDRDYIFIKQLLEATYRTPGEKPRFATREVLENGIKEGVERGIFGLGELKENIPNCIYFRQSPASIGFTENEILIRSEICEEQSKEKEIISEPEKHAVKQEIQLTAGVSVKPEVGQKPTEISTKKSIRLRFKVPEGKLSDINRVINLIRKRFDSVEVEMEVNATEGSISIDEYDMKIKEAFWQLGIDLQELESEN